MLVFGEDTPEVGRTYRHRYSPPEFVLQYLGYRLFGVVGDSREAVIGGFQEGTGWGVYSDNPAVVLLATEYVRHDIAMQIIGTHLGADRVSDLVRSNPEFIRLRASRTGGSTAAWAEGSEVATPSRRARVGNGRPTVSAPVAAAADDAKPARRSAPRKAAPAARPAGARPSRQNNA